MRGNQGLTRGRASPRGMPGPCAFHLCRYTAVWSRTVRRRSVKAHHAGSIPATAAARIRGWANGRPLGFEPGHMKVRLLLPVPGSTTLRGTFNGRTPRSERGNVGSIPAPGTFGTRISERGTKETETTKKPLE